MSKNFNQLTHAESERLALLLEELGEAQQAIGKILRHGYESRHPDGGITNRVSLERELGDVLAAIYLMARQDISASALLDHRQAKLLKVGKYLHHQDPEGL